ncbi:unnamed protein product [Microthlaspi erraticum]|uniref:Uncharacterized protein n=1 Tax=Microthlaspi erraticum TaxID=1685480 RepID=A0A6D2IP16_9BRAS|nr:unnamed protein product [Microthlaspi erraticum]
MGHEEHGGTWHMEAAQLDTQRKKGEAILKTSSTVYSTNRSSSSTRPAKLQLDRAENRLPSPRFLSFSEQNVKEKRIGGDFGVVSSIQDRSSSIGGLGSCGGCCVVVSAVFFVVFVVLLHFPSFSPFQSHIRGECMIVGP